MFEAYATLFNYNDRQFHVAGSNIFMTLSWVTALVASIIWLIKLWKSGNFSLISFRFQKVVPVLTFVISAVAALIVNSLFHASTWPAVTEDILVSYVFIQLVYTVFMTGRFDIGPFFSIVKYWMVLCYQCYPVAWLAWMQR